MCRSLLATTVCFLFVTTITSVAFSAIIHVPKDYPLIQDAIDAAQNGDTVQVAAGIYNENLVIRKSLHLQGDDKDTTFLYFAATTGIHVQAPNCTIENFTLEAVSGNASECVILDSGHNSFSNNRLRKIVTYSILVKNSHNLIADNELVDCPRGIHLYYDTGYNRIINNVFDKNAHSFIFSTINVTRSSNNEICGNYLDVVNCDGIYLGSESCHNLISGNTIVNANLDGIDISYDSNHNAVINNTLQAVGFHGIRVFCSDSNLVWGNSISTDQGAAMSIIGKNNQVFGNDIYNTNGEHLYIGPSGAGNVIAGPYPMGGNYYAVYTGTDNYSGKYQDQPGSDGIGDVPFALSSGGYDPYPLMQPYEGLSTDASSLSAAKGGTIHFFLEAGFFHGNKDYAILGGVSHVLPGTPLPNSGLTLPFNWDAFTNLMILYLNTPTFHNFLGVLDSNGSATALIDTGPITPDAVGLTLTFSYLLYLTGDVVSNPVTVSVMP